MFSFLTKLIKKPNKEVANHGKKYVYLWYLVYVLLLIIFMAFCFGLATTIIYYVGNFIISAFFDASMTWKQAFAIVLLGTLFNMWRAK